MIGYSCDSNSFLVHLDYALNPLHINDPNICFGKDALKQREHMKNKKFDLLLYSKQAKSFLPSVYADKTYCKMTWKYIRLFINQKVNTCNLALNSGYPFGTLSVKASQYGHTMQNQWKDLMKKRKKNWTMSGRQEAGPKQNIKVVMTPTQKAQWEIEILSLSGSATAHKT